GRNAIVVFNTRYLAAAAAALAEAGEPVPDELWNNVSPLHWEHIHAVGTYCFDEPAIDGELRPLRNWS
ncbi:MAG: Tn3 family transposase, partial [Dehalococcoidia bacterium]